jgi:hypothetical protein
VAGLLPGLRASSTNVAEVLKDASGGSTGLRVGRLARALVVVEVALATGFIMTMTFSKTAIALRAIDYPFDARRISSRNSASPASAQLGRRARATARDLTARLDATPGVTASALVSVVDGARVTGLLARPAALATPRRRSDDRHCDDHAPFLRRGRRPRFARPRHRGARSTWCADRCSREHELGTPLSPDREPLGRKIWLGERSLEVVGVVPDLQMQDPEDRRGDGLYVSMLQLQPYALRVLARTRGDPLALTNVVRDAVESIDRDVPLFEVSSLYDAIYSDKKVLDAFGALFFAAGVGALLLTMVGLYGIVSFAVAGGRMDVAGFSHRCLPTSAASRRTARTRAPTSATALTRPPRRTTGCSRDPCRTCTAARDR